MPVIEAHDLSFAYSLENILTEATFSIEKGEFIGIFGPNGGGKTTLLHLLMGFLKPSSGELSFEVKSGEIGFVPQHFRLDPLFPISVQEVVLMGLLKDSPLFGSYKKKEKEAAQKALEKVGMLSFLHAPFSALSGGQRQRVLLARALVGAPSILMLDEALANVDTENQTSFYQVLEELKGSVTILMVTHDLQAVLSHVDRLLCVQKTISSYCPGDVCKHFAHGLYHPPLQEVST